MYKRSLFTTPAWSCRGWGKLVVAVQLPNVPSACRGAVYTPFCELFPSQPPATYKLLPLLKRTWLPIALGKDESVFQFLRVPSELITALYAALVQPLPAYPPAI